MGVTLVLPAVLRGEAGGASQLDLDSGLTLRGALDEVRTRWPRLERRLRDERGELRRYINVYVDGEDCRHLSGQETPVPTGGEIRVIPSVAGG